MLRDIHEQRRTGDGPSARMMLSSSSRQDWSGSPGSSAADSPAETPAASAPATTTLAASSSTGTLKGRLSSPGSAPPRHTMVRPVDDSVSTGSGASEPQMRTSMPGGSLSSNLEEATLSLPWKKKE